MDRLVAGAGFPYEKASGLAIMCIDVPYDMLGVDAGWWVWVDSPEAALHPRFIEAGPRPTVRRPRF